MLLRSLRFVVPLVVLVAAPLQATPAMAQSPSSALSAGSETVVLDPVSCAAAHAQAQACLAVHRWNGVNRQPVMRSAAPSYLAVSAQTLPNGWYWHWSDSECNGLPPVCGIWSLTSTEDGVANGTSILMWNHGCTPGGILTAVTWCGALYNGGANVGSGCCEMQFGLNGEYCVTGRWAAGCINHGIRRWMWADGRPGTYSQW